MTTKAKALEIVSNELKDLEASAAYFLNKSLDFKTLSAKNRREAYHVYDRYVTRVVEVQGILNKLAKEL